MTEQKKLKWTDELVAKLQAAVAGQNPVSASTVEAQAEALGTTARSVAAKLRQLGHEVASMAKEKAPTFNAEQEAALRDFVASNAGQLTYKEIAERFEGGAFTAKQVQGKLLAMELTGSVKPAEKVEAARTYTEAEESQFVALANSGAYLEDIAAKLNKTVASVRGKALSLTRSGDITRIPAQRDHVAPAEDAITALGDKIATMTVEEIAKAIDKTERGVRTTLTRRGIKVANYDGKAKHDKAAGKREAA